MTVSRPPDRREPRFPLSTVVGCVLLAAALSGDLIFAITDLRHDTPPKVVVALASAVLFVAVTLLARHPGPTHPTGCSGRTVIDGGDVEPARRTPAPKGHEHGHG